MTEMAILTRNLGGGGECLRQLRVHLNYLRLGVDERLVTELDLFFDPCRELGSKDRMDHVDEPLLTHLLNLLPIRDVCEDWREPQAELSNIVEGQAFICRYRDEFHIFTLNICIR